MIRLFTAVGTYKLDKNGIPVIIADGRECALDTHELLLWSSLAFRILTYQEARAEFYAKERELHILGELDFDHYLNRLTMRRLIASGRDEVGVDALYDLLGHLYLEKAPSGLPAKTAAFLNLWLKKRMPFRKALAVFHTEKPEATERKLLSLLRHQQLSTAELIQCMEKGSFHIRNSRQLMEQIYAEETSDCDSIVTEGRTLEIRRPVLTAVANLYLKQLITLQIL